MNSQDLAYAVAVGAGHALTPLAGVRSKLARSLRGRGAAGARLAAWAEKGRDPARPLVWFHAPSVGEGLQARAVLNELRELRRDFQVVFTRTSPSADRLGETLDVDAADYLPWDSGSGFTSLFDALSPDLVTFTQREVWPGVTRIAWERGVPVALIAATLPEGATRLRWPAPWFLRPTFARVAAVCAIAEADAERFRSLGAPPDCVSVTGDPGVDSAWGRERAADPEARHLSPFLAEPGPTLVAGSTWPADEATLLTAAVRVRHTLPSLRLVIAPHEPTEEHVCRVVDQLHSDGWNVRRLSVMVREGTLGGATAVVVDSVGFLADLYTIGSVALVGGAFDRTGIHSVLEPAAAGLPVAFGPHHTGSRAAGELLDHGGARSVQDADELADLLETWLRDAAARERAGKAARSYVERHRGAARRSAALLAELLDSRA